MLYRPEAFEKLTERRWDGAWVRAAIAEIVGDTDAAYSPESLWPAEAWDAWGSPLPLKTLYAGAAGVAWALHALRARGVAETQLDLAAVARRALEAWREEPGVLTELELPEPAGASLFHGESGILTVLLRLEQDPAAADDLYSLVCANVRNDANEVFWGAPGTMLVARALHAWTGEERWAEAWRGSAEELWRRRDADGLWTQRLHGQEGRSLTPPHGLAGNTHVLLHGDVDDERRRDLADTAGAILEHEAVREDGLVNWPTRAGGGLEGRDHEIRLQWCAGAPGVVVSGAAYLPEDLLLAGAETVWLAGPHGVQKGASICHGTAANGYALLAAFARTGDERWLERARRFAVHALEQVVRLREQRGAGRYSLFTGDVGTALYAADCITGVPAYPVFDAWE
jgi:hypothetical protein